MVHPVLGRGAMMNLTVCDQTKRPDFVDRNFNCSDLIRSGGRSFFRFYHWAQTRISARSRC